MKNQFRCAQSNDESKQTKTTGLISKYTGVKRGGDVCTPRHLVAQHGLGRNSCTSRNSICYSATCPRSAHGVRHINYLCIYLTMCSLVSARTMGHGYFKSQDVKSYLRGQGRGKYNKLFTHFHLLALLMMKLTPFLVSSQEQKTQPHQTEMEGSCCTG